MNFKKIPNEMQKWISCYRMAYRRIKPSTIAFSTRLRLEDATLSSAHIRSILFSPDVTHTRRSLLAFFCLFETYRCRSEYRDEKRQRDVTYDKCPEVLRGWSERTSAPTGPCTRASCPTTISSPRWWTDGSPWICWASRLKVCQPRRPISYHPSTTRP